MNEVEKFEREVENNIQNLSADLDLQALSRIWIREITRHKWAYNFTWLGRPAIQFPNDMWALQEIIWKVKPDLIIETGIAHGGSLIMNASLLSLLDLTDAIHSKTNLNPIDSKRKVLGIDIDIRKHNKNAILSHPFAHKIEMYEGSSTSDFVFDNVKNFSKNFNNILVILDSNHTHDHVLRELELYSSLVSKGSYLVVFDTIIENMPSDFFSDRSWGVGNNPKTAVYEFLSNNSDFIIDKAIDNKLQISVAPEGYLKKIK